ncbi:MAG: hypothetical protein QM734_05730 [Cyclobacteriaceae bacterium]
MMISSTNFCHIYGAGALTDAELFNLLVFLFVAGYDTSKNVLTLIMNLMIDRPAEYERRARDPQFCQKVVEEIFRYQGEASVVPPGAGGFRFPRRAHSEGHAVLSRLRCVGPGPARV